MIFVGILQVLGYDFKKFRILEILNFHPCKCKRWIIAFQRFIKYLHMPLGCIQSLHDSLCVYIMNIRKMKDISLKAVKVLLDIWITSTLPECASVSHFGIAMNHFCFFFALVSKLCFIIQFTCIYIYLENEWNL